MDGFTYMLRCFSVGSTVLASMTYMVPLLRCSKDVLGFVAPNCCTTEVGFWLYEHVLSI